MPTEPTLPTELEPTGLPAIIPAQPSDAPAIADLIAEAFTPLEVAAWLIEPPAERRRGLRGRLSGSGRRH